MHAILLVGGRGTRLQPLTDTRPKPMLPIVDLPFLAHQLEHLRRHGVTDVTFACGFLPQEIIGWFGDGEAVGLRLNYVVEPEPLDTGGAIGFAARTVDRERLLVCNGDILTGLDIGALLAEHERRGAVGTIALTPVEDPSRYGLVRTAADGSVLDFLEKPEPSQVDTNLINAGTYVLEPEVIDRIPHDGRCNIEREVFPALAGEGLFAHASDAYWRDIGTFPSYLAANLDMLRGRVAGAGEYAPGAPQPARTVVADSADVSDAASLYAPCWIAPGTVVEAGATIGPGAVVARGARISDGASVVASVVLEEAQVSRGCHVVDSIVGERAVVQAGCAVSDGAVVGPGATVRESLVAGVAS